MAARQSLIAVLGVLAAAGLVALLLGWGAASGPGDPLAGDGPGRQTAPAPTKTETPSAGPDTGQQQPSETKPSRTRDVVQAVLFGLLVLVVGLIVGGVLWLGVLGLRDLALRRRGVAGRADPEQADFEVLTARERLAAGLAEWAEEQRALLTGGSPRNGIVAVWLRFEGLAGRAGVPREPWETAAEHTRRVLALAGPGDGEVPRAVGRLAELYREARFSTHELTEADRAAALAALDALHATLGVAR